MVDDGHLRLLGSETFRSNELHRLVTFLNQCLKQQGFIFGLSRDGDVYSLKIYAGRADNPAGKPLDTNNENTQAGGEDHANPPGAVQATSPST